MGEVGRHRREWIALAAILLVALGVRLAFLAERQGEPDFAYPAIDAGFHDYWARSIAVPDWEAPTHVADPRIGESPYLRPPGYPLFLAGIYAATGGGYVAPRIANHLLGLLAVVLVWLIGRRAFGTTAGLVGAAWTGTYWALVYFEGELHAPALLTALLLGQVATLQQWREHPRVGWALLAGVLGGLATLARPNVLAFFPVALVWMAWAVRSQGAPRRVLPSALALLVGGALSIAPVTVRNMVVSGEPVLISANAGINLYIGNHAGATGLVVGEIPGLGPFETCYDYPALVENLEAKVGHPLSDTAVSRWFAEQAWAWISAHPVPFLKLTLHKANLFWGPTEVSHNKVIELERTHSRVLRWLPHGFSWATAFAVAGLVLVLLGRRRAAQGTVASDEAVPAAAGSTAALLAAFTLTYFLSVLPFFAAGRYRVPVLGFLLPLSAFGLTGLMTSLARATRGRRLLPAAASSIALGLVLGITYAPAWQQPSLDHKWHMDRGRALNRAGRSDEALAEFDQALKRGSSSAEAHFSSAIALAAQGDSVGAIEAYRRVLEADPDHLKGLANLASLLGRSGRPQEAVELFRRTVQVDPAFHPGWSGLGLAYLVSGQDLQAVEAFERAVELDPENASLRNDLAWLLATSRDERARDGDRALQLIAPLAGTPAGGAGVRVDFLATLAAAQAETGRYADAVRTTEQALGAARRGSRARLIRRLEAALVEYRAGRPMRAAER